MQNEPDGVAQLEEAAQVFQEQVEAVTALPEPPVNTAPSTSAPEGGVTPPIINPNAVRQGETKTISQQQAELKEQLADEVSSEVLAEDFEQALNEAIEQDSELVEHYELPSSANRPVESTGTVKQGANDIVAGSAKVAAGAVGAVAAAGAVGVGAAPKATNSVKEAGKQTVDLGKQTANETSKSMQQGTSMATDKLFGVFDLFNRSFATNFMLISMYVAITHVVYFWVTDTSSFSSIQFHSSTYAWSWLWIIILIVIAGIFAGIFYLIRKPIDYAMSASEVSPEKRAKAEAKAAKKTQKAEEKAAKKALKEEQKAAKKRMQDELKRKREEVSDLETSLGTKKSIFSKILSR